MPSKASVLKHALRACAVKKAHADWAEAEAEALRIGDLIRDGQLDDHGKGPLLAPYRCYFCGLWHVGHLPNPRTGRKLWRAIHGLRSNIPADVPADDIADS